VRSVCISSERFFHFQYTRDIEHLKEILTMCSERVGQDMIDRTVGQCH